MGRHTDRHFIDPDGNSECISNLHYCSPTILYHLIYSLHPQELKKLKDLMSAKEKIRREQWIEGKAKKIKEITVKGIKTNPESRTTPSFLYVAQFMLNSVYKSCFHPRILELFSQPSQRTLISEKWKRFQLWLQIG